eukprot:TRINITY_DN1799_c0_g1_i5.p2 TRINITY_DN1799_c0_g1~~TRINITY_DN1799_c0_g1_i5.p2  ORF type:complete len:117 (-),score=15.19 TRINITY_DN1799_c0_g1_i5:349-699(-)
MAASDQVVAVAGAGRIVQVYDTKKWTFLGSWSNALKYEINSLHLSTSTKDHCFVGGLDSGLSCGGWSAKQGTLFKEELGDSRWLALAKTVKQDTLVGVTAQGTLYVYQYPDNINVS